MPSPVSTVSPASANTVGVDLSYLVTLGNEAMVTAGHVLDYLVEDEQTLRETLAYNLAREGYRVLEAGDGRTAIALARSERPDLVLLDLMLPEVDGFAVAENGSQTNLLRLPDPYVEHQAVIDVD